MNTFSAYIFRQALGPLLAILGALAAIAHPDARASTSSTSSSPTARAGFAFAWVTLLALPQLVSLILPLAVFFAVALRAQPDACGKRDRGRCMARACRAAASSRPIIQLAVLAAVAHLAINCVVQPWALHERRETILRVAHRHRLKPRAKKARSPFPHRT